MALFYVKRWAIPVMSNSILRCRRAAFLVYGRGGDTGRSGRAASVLPTLGWARRLCAPSRCPMYPGTRGVESHKIACCKVVIDVQSQIAGRRSWGSLSMNPERSAWGGDGVAILFMCAKRTARSRMLEHASPLIRLLSDRGVIPHDTSQLGRGFSIFQAQRRRKPAISGHPTRRRAFSTPGGDEAPGLVAQRSRYPNRGASQHHLQSGGGSRGQDPCRAPARYVIVEKPARECRFRRAERRDAAGGGVHPWVVAAHHANWHWKQPDVAPSSRGAGISSWSNYARSCTPPVN